MHIDQARSITRQGAPVAQVVTENGDSWGLHWSPETTDISGIGWKFAQIDRQGQKPYVRPDMQQARTMTFSHFLTSPASYQSATEIVRMLISVCELGVKVRLVNLSDDLETAGWWYPSLSVKITSRDSKQQIKTAQLSWTLVEAVDDRPAIAKNPPPPPPPAPPSVAGPPPGMQSDYTVVRGDSLWKIASRLLGAGERWHELYDQNQAPLNLAPPEMYAGLLTVWIYPGQVLRIPAR